MAKIEGAVNVTGCVAPIDSEDTYETHREEYGKGGYRSVANEAEKLAITNERRKLGMLVKQLDTGTIWTLEGGIDNTNWVEQPLSKTELDQIKKTALMYSIIF